MPKTKHYLAAALLLLIIPASLTAQTPALTDSLVAHWKLDEASGARNDSVGSSLLNANSTVTQAAGKLGGAAQFAAASSEGLSVVDNAALSMSPSQAFTLSAWYYIDTAPGAYAVPGLIVKDTDSEYELVLEGAAYGSGIRFRVWNTVAPNYYDLRLPSYGALSAWHFVLAWYDPAAGKIFLQLDNGTPAELACPAGPADGAGNLGLGRYHNGRIDHVAIWKRVLSSSERTELWNNGAGKELTGGAPTPTPTPSSGQWLASGSNIYYNAGNVGIGTGTPATKLHVLGDLTVTGNIAAKYQDVAEWVRSTQHLAAGTVVVLDPGKSNQVIASTRAYDTAVAGVVSAQPGLSLGEAADGKLLVATTGRVKVMVDATRAPIRVGDLLVTSDVTGVAMKSIPVNAGGARLHRPGTLIGKALEPLEKGKGEILVLLSLQ
jgi:hypothetical protein